MYCKKYDIVSIKNGPLEFHLNQYNSFSTIKVPEDNSKYKNYPLRSNGKHNEKEWALRKPRDSSGFCARGNLVIGA